MVSVLGPIFSHFYMSALENKVFNTINKPKIYLRYADDILLTNSTYEITTIQETFQDNSVLNFTQKINNNKIPFFGVLIDTNNNDRFFSSAYKKKLLTLIPAPLFSKVNAPSAIKKKTIIQTLISKA